MMRQGDINKTNSLLARIIVCVSFVSIVLTQHTEVSDILVRVCNYLIAGLFIFGIMRSKFAIHDRYHIVSHFFILNVLSLIAVLIVNSRNYAWFSEIRAIRGQAIYMVFFIVSFFVVEYVDDLKFPYKLLHYLSLLAGVIVIIQSIANRAGVNLHGIPVLGEFVFNSTDGFFRPSAFFGEPSYFAEVVVLDLFFNLFITNNYKMAVFNIISLIPTYSGVGVLLAGSMLLSWVLTKQVSKNVLINFVTKLVTGGCLFLFVYNLVIYDGDNILVNRLTRGATINQRTYRGIEIFGNLDPIHKTFGVGMQNVSSYLDLNRITLENDREDTLVNREFMQSFYYLLCTLGVCGSFSSFFCFGELFKNMKGYKRLIIIFLILLMFVSSMICRSIFILWMIMIAALL